MLNIHSLLLIVSVLQLIAVFSFIPAFATIGVVDKQSIIEKDLSLFRYQSLPNGDVWVGGLEKDHGLHFVQQDNAYQTHADSLTTFREYQPAKYLLQSHDEWQVYFDSPIHKKVTRVISPEGKTTRFLYGSNLELNRIIEPSNKTVGPNSHHFSYPKREQYPPLSGTNEPGHQDALDCSVTVQEIANPDDRTQHAVTLEDFLPEVGPPGTTGTEITPQIALRIPEVVAATAVDFIDENNRIKAALLLMKTSDQLVQDNGMIIQRRYAVLEHDYPACALYRGYTLGPSAPVALPALVPDLESRHAYFWYAQARKQEDHIIEEALVFHVFVNHRQRQFLIDSRWVADNYPKPSQFDFEFDYVLNFQIWSVSAQETYQLLQRIVRKLADYQDKQPWSLSFLNTDPQPSPTIDIKHAEFDKTSNEVILHVQNWLSEAQDVTFYGCSRSYYDWETFTKFTREINNVKPGFTKVVLSFEKLLDAQVFAEVDGFLSKAYTGGGFWFPVQSKDSLASMAPQECQQQFLGDDETRLSLPGCLEIEGQVKDDGFIGVSRTLNPSEFPEDLSKYNALVFSAKGDDKGYLVNIVTQDDDNKERRNIYYQHKIRVSPEWKWFAIPFSKFIRVQKNSKAPELFNGKGVIDVGWTSLGHPHETIKLKIANVMFAHLPDIRHTTQLPDTTNEKGPYVVSTTIRKETTTALLYSRDKGQTFTQVPMNRDKDTYIGEIPGVPLDSVVHYYVETVDEHGNRVTDPVNAPFATYHFQVSEVPALLVDDFNNPASMNFLGERSSLFGPEPRAVSSIYKDGALVLDYDVSGAQRYGGYYTLLKSADLTPYHVLSFQVKGVHGGEQLSLAMTDQMGNTQKFDLSQMLTRGITTSWQTVKLPLKTLTPRLDLTKMESMAFVIEKGLGSSIGAVYIDELKFLRHKPTLARVGN